MPRKSSNTKSSIKVMPSNIPSIVTKKPSFLQNLKDGLAFGVGSSIGHRIVGALIPSYNQDTNKKEEYEQCMKKYDDISVCKEIL